MEGDAICSSSTPFSAVADAVYKTTMAALGQKQNTETEDAAATTTTQATNVRNQRGESFDVCYQYCVHARGAHAYRKMSTWLHP